MQNNSQLTPKQRNILYNKQTEPPFSGALLHNEKTGVYQCAGCGNPIFSSTTKFDSGTGWPSFYDSIRRGAVSLKPDMSHGMKRTEVTCAQCGGHLGHVFPDGPRPTGQRYCINSAALRFSKTEK